MVISFLALFILLNVPNHYTSNNIFQPSDTIVDNKFEMKYKFPQKILNFPLSKQINITYFIIIIKNTVAFDTSLCLVFPYKEG